MGGFVLTASSVHQGKNAMLNTDDKQRDSNVQITHVNLPVGASPK